VNYKFAVRFHLNYKLLSCTICKSSLYSSTIENLIFEFLINHTSWRTVCRRLAVRYVGLSTWWSQDEASEILQYRNVSFKLILSANGITWLYGFKGSLACLQSQISINELRNCETITKIFTRGYNLLTKF
jgi:hypothetical protein